MTRHYETDDKTFPADAYTVKGYRGIAWYVLGWEVSPDDDTEWTGIEERTGDVVAVMVGDDRRFAFSPDEMAAIARDAYCGGCGQIGCGHDGLDRNDAAIIAEERANDAGHKWPDTGTEE